MPRVLVVDDEPQIQRFLRPSLGANGYDMIEAATGAEALRRAAADAPDVVVLDLGLPDMDGKDVIRQLRAWSEVPVIVLSARDREAEKIEALDLGADDFVNKPFGIGELMARLRAALRHRLRKAGETPVFRAGSLVVDLVKRLVTRDGEPVRMSPKEYDLLRVLVQAAGRVVTHRQLLVAVWGPAHVEDTQYLRVYVGQLRHKIEDDPTQPRLVLTEPGVGYRLFVEE
ncbi:MAG: response regulator [Alphaproteobacteria bacterium]|nr:response regulator [Alphaproteobacteria bacterium]